MNKEKAIKFYNKYGIAVILLGLLIICYYHVSGIFIQANIVNLLSQIAVVTVITCGITQLIIAGQTDLSGGAIVALTGCICVGTYKNLSEGGMNGWLAGIVAVLAAVLVGMIVNFLCRVDYYRVSCTGIYCNTGNDAGRKRCLLYLYRRNTDL